MLMRDGTAEPVSRDQILRRANGDREKNIFPVQLITRADLAAIYTRLIHNPLNVLKIHTYYVHHT